VQQTSNGQRVLTTDDFYSFWAPPKQGALLNSHVGDGIGLRGFDEGNMELPADVVGAMSHPIFSNSTTLVGLGALVVLVWYMDKRIKVRL
jgi:hypothetical protein